MEKYMVIIRLRYPLSPYSFAADTLPIPVKDHPVWVPRVSHAQQWHILQDFSLSPERETYCSAASLFIPSSKTPVTFSFRYLRAGAPCGAAFDGMGAVTSAFTLPFVVRVGVAVR